MLSFLSYYSNPIGVVGVVLVLALYVLLQLNKLSPNSFWFSFLNAVASLFVLVSLFYHWNLASVIIEVSWLIISLYGVARWTFRKTIRKID